MQEHELVVIGGGIAGMSAALTAARLGRRTAVLAGGLPGGELLNVGKIDGIPGFPEGIAGFDLCPITQELAMAAGAEFITEESQKISREKGLWKVTGSETEYLAHCVILAMGARFATLNVPGEAEFMGRGISHCASCDAPLLRGKVAVVVGGGDSGMQEALILANHLGKVVIVEQRTALSGQRAYVDEVRKNPRIEVLTSRQIVAIGGDARVERVRLKDVSSGEDSELPADAVFPFVGLEPNVGLASELVQVDEKGLIEVDALMRTSAEGIFAAGNLRGGSSWRAAGAIGDGVTAATSVERYLTNQI